MPHKDPVEHKQYQRDYHQRPEVKAKTNASTQAYYKTERGKKTRRKHLESSKGRQTVNSWSKRYRYQKEYGITPEQKEELLVAQGYRCKSCGSMNPGRKNGQWSTDHLHGTKIIRGILCNGCNSAIGHAHDDPTKLRMMAKYLEDQPFLPRSVT